MGFERVLELLLRRPFEVEACHLFLALLLKLLVVRRYP